jgi:vacuolar-type H+-ATPase subunit H
MTMKAEEIFNRSVQVMKEILTPEEMTASLQRAKKRTEEENQELLNRQRENINELVRKIADGSKGKLVESVPQELIDALVMRYLRNRDIFMKTFPDGIDDISQEPVTLWAAIMISPRDDAPLL